MESQHNIDPNTGRPQGWQQSTGEPNAPGWDDPARPNQNNSDDPNSERNLHPAVADSKPYAGSGKDVGLVNPPIVSVNPSSGNEQDTDKKAKHKVIKGADEFLCLDPNANYDFPFADLKLDEGMFIPNDAGMTTDKHMEKMYPVIYRLRQQYSEVARNEEGDEIWEQITIKVRKKNDDGTLQLEGDGKPIEGANFVHLPKLIPLRDFTVKAVVKGDKIGGSVKAPSDGVVVIRVI